LAVNYIYSATITPDLSGAQKDHKKRTFECVAKDWGTPVADRMAGSHKWVDACLNSRQLRRSPYTQRASLTYSCQVVDEDTDQVPCSV